MPSLAQTTQTVGTGEGTIYTATATVQLKLVLLFGESVTCYLLHSGAFYDQVTLTADFSPFGQFNTVVSGDELHAISAHGYAMVSIVALTT
jgi:hypothetical protein